MFWLAVDRNQSVPMIRQVYEQIRLHILQGELHQGERLPSTRDLAENLKVSRNVVLEAYEQLMSEGYINTFRGSGTFVAKGTYLNGSQVRSPLELNQTQYDVSTQQKDIIDFRFGVPALDLFPWKKWNQLLYNVCAVSPPSVFGYGKPEGCDELRETLSHYLVRARGVYCNPEQVIITTGAIQAIYLVANLLLSAGDEIITEDPMNLNVRKILLDTGAKVTPVPVDELGLQVDQIPCSAAPRLIYLTPSHQFPLGATLPIQRRIELIEFARQKGCYILEDNYENEFRFEGTPVSSLQGLDPNLVIYTGTFSKILCPALRIGYLVVPPNLASKIHQLKNLLDHHSPSLNQLVLAQFIEQGLFERHISKMKKIYRKRQEAIIRSLDLNFPQKFRISGHSSGLHMVIEFDDVIFADHIVEGLEYAGVRVYPMEMYAAKKGRYFNKILLGYGNTNEEEIAEGITIMKRFFEKNHL